MVPTNLDFNPQPVIETLKDTFLYLKQKGFSESIFTLHVVFVFDL
jgi:hypothetical protein